VTYEQAWMAQQVVAVIATILVLLFQLWAYRKTRHASLAVLVCASGVALLASFFSLLSRVPDVQAISFYASAVCWLVATALSVVGVISLLRWVVAMASSLEGV